MFLNMSRTTSKKFEQNRFFKIFDILGNCGPLENVIFWTFLVKCPNAIFFLENNWDKKDAGRPYDQFDGGMRP